MKFRKKPVIIEAICWTGNHLELFLLGLNRAVYGSLDGGLDISTLEGTMHANIGDWIIKGIKGELYPCKPDIFEATYEKVED